jgi:hypothetical protein
MIAFWVSALCNFVNKPTLCTGLLITFFFLGLNNTCRPYCTDGLSNVHSLSLVAQFITLFGGVVLVLHTYMRREAIQAGEKDSTSTENSMIEFLIFFSNGTLLIWPAIQMINVKMIKSIARTSDERMSLLFCPGSQIDIVAPENSAINSEKNIDNICSQPWDGLMLVPVSSDLVISCSSAENKTEAIPLDDSAGGVRALSDFPLEAVSPDLVMSWPDADSNIGCVELSNSAPISSDLVISCPSAENKTEAIPLDDDSAGGVQALSDFPLEAVSLDLVISWPASDAEKHIDGVALEGV